MSISTSIGSRIVAEELRIQRLLDSAALVGGIYTMGYDDCLVLTNDIWKERGGGIPQHCFLLASAMTPGHVPGVEDEEVILLRVVGRAALPAEADLVHVRAEAMRELVTTQGSDQAGTPSVILDVLTRNEIQFSGIKAKILGTFYDAEVNGVPLLGFGSDIETFHSASRYKVYKPFGASLAAIASYPQLTEEEERQRQAGGLTPRRVRIGSVRYSSASRRRQMNVSAEQDTAVPVRVNVRDFVALKTAVFGMTRLGKSNTMKIIATAVCQHAAETGQRIGQLLFDPAGEYANINVQDQTALSQIGTEFVTIFRYGAARGDPGVRPLSSNFFSDRTIDVTWAIITAYLTPRNQSNYIRSFLAADVGGPENPSDDWSAHRRAQRRRAALYATLLKAGFRPPNSLRLPVAVNARVLEKINEHLKQDDELFRTNRGNLTLNERDLQLFWDCVVAAREADGDLEHWVDAELEAILALYTGSVGSGFRLLEPLRVYHSPSQTSDYAEEVLNELIQGKIVIVDLSLGSETVLRFCSERIVNHILQDAARRFAAGEDLHSIQIYIEEAHRLFNRDRMNVPEEADPYVRLAKEAAKYKLGLIYATQEVTSVDAIILSNTSNWIVTHLNNRSEVKELSKYYDFEDFAELTLRAEDVGFTRVKTRSGRYIVPTQIDLFDASGIEAARQACLAAAEAEREDGG